MDYDRFYDKLESFETLYERLEFFKTCDYDMNDDPQPDAMLGRFYQDIETVEDACQVIRAFKYRFGDMIVCVEGSKCLGSIITIVDDLDYEIDSGSYSLTARKYGMLMVACDRLNVKRASEYDPRAITSLYFACGHTDDTDDFIEYDYDLIEDDNKLIHEELQMYIFHPSRIQKWLDDGNELEDYMN